VSQDRIAQAMRDHLHPADIEAWVKLIPLAFEAAKAHGIELREFLPDSTAALPGAKRDKFCTGYAFKDGRIAVCIRMRDNDGSWCARRPEPDYLRTLAHELAHLVQWNHGAAHDRTTENILNTIQDIRRGTWTAPKRLTERRRFLL
jgi:hypothetical protein